MNGRSLTKVNLQIALPVSIMSPPFNHIHHPKYIGHSLKRISTVNMTLPKLLLKWSGRMVISKSLLQCRNRIFFAFGILTHLFLVIKSYSSITLLRAAYPQTSHYRASKE
ncbi:MAG: hypothetical protein ACI8P3_000043 [Saprospiraceae bacterium]|jgi:hypothetical protein